MKYASCTLQKSALTWWNSHKMTIRSDVTYAMTWKALTKLMTKASRIHLFIKGKKHGRMMLDSIDNGPLVYPTIEEDRQTRPKKYSKLTEAQQLQDDYNVQATNIILHGLPPDVYALVNLQEAAKDIWDRLINDMHTIGMTMQQVQVNTKFLNALPPKWSKFVTNVKLAKSLCTTNYDQLYAYLSQHERIANEVRSSTYPPPQQFTPVYAAPINHQQHHTMVNPQQQSFSPQPFISPSVTQQSQVEILQLDSGLAIPICQQGQDPIDCINKAMAFLSTVASRGRAHGEIVHSAKEAKKLCVVQGEVDVSRSTRSCVIAKEHDVISVIDDEERLILEEESRSKMLDK
ncbi:hypothetical protein Tco_0499558 [Tanacetum coccineum]